MSVKEKLRYTREVITVEPLFAAYVMAAFLCKPALRYLEFEKSCRVNLNLDDPTCDAILLSEHDNYTEQNNQILYLISNMYSWQLPLTVAAPLVLVLFLGSYSDRRQWRKPFLLLPIFGEFFGVFGCILCVVFMKSLPLEAQGVFQTVIPSLFGGQTMLVMAVYSYIADVSTVEMRTLRIGVMQIVLNFITPVTQSFSAHLFNLTGYYGVLLVAGGLYLFGFLYGLFFIKEPRKIKAAKKSFCADVFDPAHAIETFNLVLKKKEGNKRIYIWIVLVTLLFYNIVNVGEGSVFYLYAQSNFKWTPLEMAYFETLNTVVHLIGTAAGVPIFAYFKLSDLTILLLTFLNKILTNLFFGFANTDALLYTATIISIVVGITPIGMRSLATKIVSENDLGKAQSLFGICEAIGVALSSPIYNKGIFNNTATDFPAAFFFFGILLYGICCVLFVWMYIREKAKKKRKSAAEKDKELPMDSYIQTTHM
ncbi:unnamed protein product [Acanthoscelides obtectus]|nr:unnamed protein product [Acanthoscelides obtectus]CAK1658585.1 Solute carrier family 46 member 3 [Acanthoscelides obtectus]